MVLVTKIFSLLVLWGFINLYEPVQYDIRPLQLCLLVCIIAHCAIVFQLKAFDEEYLSFTKNLPVSAISRFATVAATFFILLLPELIFVWKGYGLYFIWSDYPEVLLFCLAMLCMFYTVLLLGQTNMEQYIRIVFAISTVCFFILLYNPGILFPLAVLFLSCALFASYIYHYEHIEKL
jgi:hypothetical protein